VLKTQSAISTRCYKHPSLIKGVIVSLNPFNLFFEKVIFYLSYYYSIIWEVGMRWIRFFRRALKNLFVVNLVLAGFIFGVVFSVVFITVGCQTNGKGGNISFASSVDLSKLSEEYKYAYSVQRVLNEVAEKVAPAVVNIKSEDVITWRVEDPFYKFFGEDEFLRKFFDLPDRPQSRTYRRVVPSLGSGFIISKDGYILSNLHVLKPAGKIAKNIVVTVLKSGREYKAKLVGYDEETDIALLKIEPREDLPVVTLGDSDKVRVGDFAIAIGNPFGLNGTFTFGTISAVNRDFAGNVFSKYIQTDAPINPGNSGGPLVNIFGEVIGINTMIISPTGQLGVAGNVGIGFAIPINTAKRVVDQLIKKGKVERGYIGVSINELDNDTRKQLGIPEDVGVLVSKVEPGSPADKAGIKQGDIIVAVDGEKISNFNDLLSRIASKLPGEKAEIEVIRNGKRIKFVLEVIARPSSEELSRKMEQGRGEGSTAEYKGVIVSEGKRGVIVTGVNDDSPFYGILQRGDEIVEINGQKISNLDDFRKFAEKNKNQKQFLIKFYRGDMFIIRGFTIK